MILEYIKAIPLLIVIGVSFPVILWFCLAFFALCGKALNWIEERIKKHG